MIYEEDEIKIWKTKEGKIIKIVDMENGHLLNTIKLIERVHAHQIACYLNGPQPRGEMAQDAFDREFDQLDEEGPSATHPAYDYLVIEADNRKIDSKEARTIRQMNLDLIVLESCRKF